MIRIATLLPAFTLAVALATTGVAMAAQNASKDQGPGKQHDKTSAYSSTCDARSLPQTPSYCLSVHGNKR
jgi:hypothetical protein